MISMQSYNQVLYHLTQLTSAVNPISTPLPVKLKQNEPLTKDKDDISCSSLAEATTIYTEMPLNKLNMYNISMLRRKKDNVWVILNKLSTKTCKKHLERDNKWKSSYVSGASFTENKRSFPCASLTEPIILPIYLSPSKQCHRTSCTLCVKNSYNYIPSRSFKTQRNMKMDTERNPSFTSRLQKWLGLQTFTDAGARLTHELRSADAEKFKHLFGNSETSTEVQQKLKSAFVEGYEAGLHRQIRTRTLWTRIVPAVVMGVMLISGYLLLISSTGSLVRFAMGQKAEINPETVHVTFNDVKGVEEAKQELMEVVAFLKNPEKFSALGGKLPKGVLLVGPPGTGKTLLARAVAGEANVPFFHAAGPEFDEVLVGQGARRVRELFKAAKEKAPAVIFIDEIDSVGQTRTNSFLHPYANQTINQLLAEMDGFLQNEGVIVLGATNRRDDLDRALMRPGRFDVQVFVNKPDFRGRKEIFDLYLSRILTRDVDAEALARCTIGFTGADIENVVNQAALRAAINNADYVTKQHLEYALDKVVLGPEGKSKMTDENVKLITAYHEAGHALVAYYAKDGSPIHKVTIIPRGPSLGHTALMPQKDMYLHTKANLLATMDTLMGGRAAEELIFGLDKITTGAQNDFQGATQIAEEMVKHYGMSEKVGFRIHTNGDNNPLSKPDCGPHTYEVIDAEIKRLLQESYERAKTVLKNHAKEHKELAEALVKYETLDLDDVKAIVNGKKVRIESLNNQTPIHPDPSKIVL